MPAARKYCKSIPWRGFVIGWAAAGDTRLDPSSAAAGEPSYGSLHRHDSLRGRQRAFEEMRRRQRAVIAGEAPNDLHAQRKPGLVDDPRYIHAGRAEDGPEPVENGISRRLESRRRGARR